MTHIRKALVRRNTSAELGLSGRKSCFPQAILFSSLLALIYNPVDPAGNHMLMSKIKPCKCKNMFLNKICGRLITRDITHTSNFIRIPVVILELIRGKPYGADGNSCKCL